MSDAQQTVDAGHDEKASRRDFLNYLAVATGGVGAVGFVWPVVDSMNPSADVLALASIEVDLSAIEVGQNLTVKWRGKPVFIRRRTADEIAAAQTDDAAALPDIQADADRVQSGKEEWLVLVGVCTHLGCVPLGQKPGDERGEFGGWFCPCHGSHYDTSGRIRKGPAPRNLSVPPYTFKSDTLIQIG